MNITAELIRDFLLRRLKEEENKGTNCYTTIDNQNGYGVHYTEYVKEAISTYLYEDLKYAFEKDPQILYPPREMKLSDFSNVKESIEHIVEIYGPVLIDSVVIIPRANIAAIAYDHLNLTATRSLYSDLKHRANLSDKDADWWGYCNSYSVFYRKEHNMISIVVHEDSIPDKFK